MKIMPSLFIGAAICVLSACATAPQSVSFPLKDTTKWVLQSPEWREEAQAVYSEAAAFVQTQSKARAPGSWAIVLDLDETVMNNVQYTVSREKIGKGYSPESWHAWTQEQRASLVPGALSFINMVNTLGGHIAFVTNRNDTEQLATENNLAKLDFLRGENFEILLTKTNSSDKDARYAIIDDMLAAQGFPNVTTIAYIGDNKKDKPSAEGAWSFFCIDQGDMYGDPCAKVPGSGR